MVAGARRGRRARAARRPARDLSDLCAFRIQDHQPGGIVDDWRELLSGGERPPAEQKLRSSRLAASAAVAAWADIIGYIRGRGRRPGRSAYERRSARRQALADQHARAIRKNAEPGTRAAAEAPGSTAATSRISCSAPADSNSRNEEHHAFHHRGGSRGKRSGWDVRVRPAGTARSSRTAGGKVAHPDDPRRVFPVPPHPQARPSRMPGYGP